MELPEHELVRANPGTNLPPHEIRQRPYSIGYLQTTYAIEARLQTGLAPNSNGKFIRADGGSIASAAAATATNMPDDFRASITNSNDEAAYPISSFTWILVPQYTADRVRREAIVEFLKWVLGDGQQFAQPLHYAALPGDVAVRVRKALDRIQ